MSEQAGPEPVHNGVVGRGLEDERIDVRRYLGALRRGRYLIAAIVVVVTVVVVALSLLISPTYEAEATLQLDQPSSDLLATDAQSVERQLATFGTLIGSRAVSERAAEEVDGASADEISDAVSSSVDEEANLIAVQAEDADPDDAAEIANAVAAAFIGEQRRIRRQEARNAIAELEDELDRVESADGSEEEAGRIQDLIDQLTLESINAGRGLRIAEQAEPPETAVSPRPFRNGVLALVASLILGVVAALVRDQLRGRVDDTRQLARLIRLPVLVEVPYAGGRRGRRPGAIAAPEREAYRTLAAEVDLSLADSEHHTILVTSALIGEGKTTVTARLGLALAEAGQRPLLVSGDLRHPRLHEMFGLGPEPGLSEALRRAEHAGVSEQMLSATAQTVQLPTREGANRVGLDVLSAGNPVGNPARLLSGSVTRELFEQAAGRYRYVLIDAPPLLGQADAQALARVADHVLVVARPDRLGLETIEDMQGALRRLGVEALGLVVIGGRAGPGYYGPDGGPFGDEATDAAWQAEPADGQGARIPGGWVRWGMGPRR